MKSKKSASARQTVAKKHINPITWLSESMKNDTMHFVAGASMIVVTLFMLIACISFLFNGGTDQSVLEAGVAQGSEIANSTGVSGASLSEKLINHWFGLPSFIMFAFLIVTGLNLMKLTHLRLLRWFICSSFLMVWLSVFCQVVLAPFFRASFIIPGGYHGRNITDLLSGLIGLPGIILILALSMLLFCIYLTHKTIDFIRSLFTHVSTSVREDLSELSLPSIGRKKKDDADSQDEDEEVPEPVEEHATLQQPQQPAEQPVELPEETLRTVEFLSPDEDVDFVENLDEEDIFEIKEEEEEPSAEAETEPEDKEEIDFEVHEGVQEEAFDGKIPEPYNPRLDLSHYKFPHADLLKHFEDVGPVADREEQNANKERIINVLKSFGIDIKSISATVGPTVTLYEITPAEGVRISKIRNLEDDIALSLAALGIRIIAPIPGKGTIGIEVPNAKSQIVAMQPIVNSRKFVESNMELPVALGRTITNDIFMFDLAKMPHLLVAGATGQGKSVGLNAIITSLLYKKHPAEMKLVMVDPKMVEFSVYSPIEKHFLAKMPEEKEAIITDTQKVVYTLKSLCIEMDARYELLKSANVRAIKEYNAMFIDRKLNPLKGHRYLPYIVVIIDEFGDLIMTAGKDIEMPIARIAQKARAVGIHMIIATQRPTTSIITGNIKANFPARIAFRVSSMIDSRTILDKPGANQLLGRGDMLFLQGSDPVRVQCAFVDTPEVNNICSYISEQQGYTSAYELPEYVDENSTESSGSSEGLSRSELDPLFEEAARLIVAHQSGSTSLIQRKFSIGYNRAGRLMDQLERAGIVGAAEGSKPRQVLCMDDVELDSRLSNI
ncbi:MAG: DNA translocase FtsK [Bacteroidaceae bacterium]|nr:DNA translocase FtsK [Bacteroidaceae bacterium]